MSQYWCNVRLAKQSMGGGKTGPSGQGSGQPLSNKKKKNQKTKKNQEETANKGQEGINRAVYCFRCGSESYNSKKCTVKTLKCEEHKEAKSHNTKACADWRRKNY